MDIYDYAGVRLFINDGANNWSIDDYGSGAKLNSTHIQSNGAWMNVVMTDDGTTLRSYFNGVADATGTNAPPGQVGLYFGNGREGGSLLTGKVDETTFSSTVRSTDWIGTQYNNQSSPSTFYAYGTLQSQTRQNSFASERAITIQGSQVPASQTNFTVLICANGSSPCNTSVSGLNQTGAGAGVDNPNGYDIVFTTDSSCTSKLNWEMEKYVSSTGEIEAWVLIPSLGTSNQAIYMCYGNSSISTFQGGSTGVAWNSSYKGVWHMPNGSSFSGSDSTTNNNSITPQGTAAAGAGKIDGGLTFLGGGAGNNAIVPATTAYNFGTGDFSVSGWVKFTDTAWATLLGNYDGTHALWLVAYNQNASGFPSIVTTSGTVSSNATIDDGGWHYLVATRISGTLAINVDGVQKSTGSDSSNVSVSGGTNLGIGMRTDGFGALQQIGDTVDEIHINSVGESANWITTEYNNQSSPSTFETFGSSVAPSGFSIKQTTNYTNVTACNTSATTLVYGTAPTPGDLLVVGVSAFGAVTTPSGWTALASESNTPAGPLVLSMFSHVVGASETNSYVFNFAGGANCANAMGYEISGQAASSPIDQSGANGYASSNNLVTTPALTPSAIGELAISFLNMYVGNGTGVTAPVSAGWTTTLVSGGNYYSAEYASNRSALTTDTATAISNTFTTGSNVTWYDSAIVLIKSAANLIPAVKIRGGVKFH